ncbi:helix-turn-helix domain-containing protein [Micromonospora sp. NPDC048930]|uniref:helix-turn-helix domain-containing protein n=1 Tax=Micromonospora sp. NPDC048930 TaxID=3364261 RepID=UPI00371C437D
MAASKPGERDEAGVDRTRWSLADKINNLFDTIRRPDGTPHSNEEVAAAMAKTGGTSTISATYLWLLRRGERDNPTKRHLEALAKFFDVSPAYFFDDAKSRAIADELAAVKLLSDARISRVATRLGGLSTKSLRHIADIVEHVRAIEGLDTPTSAAEDSDNRR